MISTGTFSNRLPFPAHYCVYILLIIGAVTVRVITMLLQ